LTADARYSPITLLDIAVSLFSGGGKARRNRWRKLNSKKNGSSAHSGNHSRPLEINCEIRFCYIFAFLKFCEIKREGERERERNQGAEESLIYSSIQLCNYNSVKIFASDQVSFSEFSTNAALERERVSLALSRIAKIAARADLDRVIHQALRILSSHFSASPPLRRVKRGKERGKVDTSLSLPRDGDRFSAIFAERAGDETDRMHAQDKGAFPRDSRAGAPLV